ncbi:hypothetical protein Trydic_g18924 [Trypoxylus dichotomus]
MLLVRPLEQIDIVINANATSQTLDNDDSSSSYGSTNNNTQRPTILVSLLLKKFAPHSHKSGNNQDVLGKRHDRDLNEFEYDATVRECKEFKQTYSS